jgi:glutamate synthase (NADPH/NADH) small chain
MGKTTGFLDYKNEKATQQLAKERLKHYQEFEVALSTKKLTLQGARCMDCGIPFCHSSFGCPVVNLIPEWNDLIYHNQWQEAYERLEMTNNFPEFTGRICPAPCETACTLAIDDQPVTIKQIELAIIERAFREGWVKPKPADHLSGHSIAIIGSGPAGLAAAQQLSRWGHAVTVYEKGPKPGGLLRYGIPDFKLEKRYLDRRLDQMKAEGVNFVTDVNIGEDLSARYLQKIYDIILIATGATQPNDLNVQGRQLQGIYFAMDYLAKSNMYIDGLLNEEEIISARDKTVLVIGGGDTGSDCVGTANRQGAKKIYQFEILSKPQEWNKSWNPEWPNWPNILRSSSSHEEGCHRDWGVLTKSFSGKNGVLNSAEFVRVKWENPTNGKKVSLKEIPKSDFTLKLDLVFLAMGFIHPEHSRLLTDFGIEFEAQGNIKTGKDYMTSVDGVFSAGDACTGASLVVQAIYHGRKAAEAINEYLTS